MAAQRISGSIFPKTDEKYWIYHRWAWWINQFFYMKDYGILPKSGGLFEQDWMHMEIFNIIKGQYTKTMKRINKK